jgi:hypothetical protein
MGGSWSPGQGGSLPGKSIAPRSKDWPKVLAQKQRKLVTLVRLHVITT